MLYSFFYLFFLVATSPPPLLRGLLISLARSLRGWPLTIVCQVLQLSVVEQFKQAAARPAPLAFGPWLINSNDTITRVKECYKIAKKTNKQTN